jgi:peptidoglycan-N-acetylglucosamine deacetylase
MLSLKPSEGFRVFISFDDGPDPHFTPELLKSLRLHGVIASFFLIGNDVVDHPVLVQMIREAGHAVHLHGWQHRKIRHAGLKVFSQEIEMCRTLLNSNTFRPPYGRIPLKYLFWLKRNGYTTVLWNVDFTDYRSVGHSLENILKYSNRIRPGDIVLLHNKEAFSDRTINILNVMIPELKKKNVIFDRIL